MNDQLASLKPKVRRLAEALLHTCADAGIEIEVVRGHRTPKQQDEYYAQGRTKPGEIITMVQGGHSFHNYGVAFDIRPLHFKDEEDKADIRRKVGPIGESLGLEWGGRWKDFEDLPHFQYTAGYSIDDFLSGNIDWSRFD
jgi:hypothetical protein